MASHTRSNSFPSRPHPFIEEVNEQVRRLRSSAATSTSSSSISHKLSSLQDLHDCVDRLIQLPLNQHALAQEKQQKSANVLLDGSLRLLDVCSIIKEALLQTRESLQALQSIIRRRGGESGVHTSEVRKYLTSRKIVKKTIDKVMVNTRSSFSTVSKESEDICIVNILRDVEAVTLSVFESLLSFISGPKASSSWSLVSKMMHSKRVACEEDAEINEFAEVDAALKSVKNAENIQNQLSSLESCIRDQEEGLQSLFRQLIKNRVSLLNILSH